MSTAEDTGTLNEGIEIEEEVDRLYRENGDFNDFLDAQKAVQVAGHTFLPSQVLKELDPDGYKEALRDWEEEQKRIADEERLQLLLEQARQTLDAFESNRTRFHRVVERLEANRLIPFVGAGLSVSCGNPGWTDFLLKLAGEAGGSVDKIEDRLTDGDYRDFERVAQDLVEEIMNPNWFNERLRDLFTLEVELAGPVQLFPDLFQGCLITTNFDRVLEDVYQGRGTNLMPVYGRRPQPFTSALRNPSRKILKVHGDLSLEARERILTRDEYDESYGTDGIDPDLPLPKVLIEAFRHSPFLFIGCSLGPDRLMKLWKVGVAECEGGALPRHYAIAEAPETEDERRAKEHTLTEHGIFPIWFANGNYGAVEALLTLAVEVVEGREDMDG